MKSLSTQIQAVIAAAILIPAIARAGSDSPPPVKFSVYPVIMNARTNAIDIMWESTEAAAGKVRIGTSSSLSGAALLTDSRAIKIHKLTITGLAQNKKYYYRVELTDESSPINKFDTAPSATTEPFRMVSFSDTRKGYGPEAWLLEAGEDDDHRAVSKAALAKAPDLYVNAGDFGFAGQDQGDVTNFFLQEKELLGNTVFYPTYGNHDFAWFFGLSDASLGTGNTLYDSYFMVPSGGDFDYYSFNYSNVAFVSVNANGCNSAEECPSTYAPGTAQYNFIKAKLDAAQANAAIKTIVVSHHQPVVGDGGVHSGFDALRALYESHSKVKLVITAHVHNYERATYNGITYLVLGGGGSPLSGTNSSGYTNAISENLNFLVADYTSTGVTFKAYGVVGDDNTSTWQLDSWSLAY